MTPKKTAVKIIETHVELWRSNVSRALNDEAHNDKLKPLSTFRQNPAMLIANRLEAEAMLASNEAALAWAQNAEG